MLEENPDLQTQEFADEIRQMILDAVEMEERVQPRPAAARDPRPQRRLHQPVCQATWPTAASRSSASRPHYRVTNPAKWMAAANDTLELVNFFESTNTSYEVGARTN